MERPKTTIPCSYQDSFVFRQRTGEMNWREIQNLDIDLLIQSGNISKINEILENLTYSNIEKTDLERFPDNYILKLIRLSQFALEYLQQQKVQLEVENEEIKREKAFQVSLNSELEGKIQTFNKRTSHLNSQIKTKKKVLSIFEQYILKQPNMINVIKRIDRDQHIKCSTCGKVFENFHYYESHRKRRHDVPSRPQTAQIFDMESMKSSLEEQLKLIQVQHEQEMAELKAVILQQSQSKPVLKDTVMKIDISKSNSEIDLLKKELLEIRTRKKRQEEVIQERHQEIRRIEAENKKLAKKRESLKIEFLKSRMMESQRSKNSEKEVPVLAEAHGHRRRKLTSESGMTNYVNHIYNDLVDRPFDQRYEESKRGVSPYSERLSPSFKEQEEEEYVYQIEAPEPQVILKAAKFLGIDAVKETQFLYLAREFLRNPIPKHFKLIQNEGKNEFLNKETGQVQENHPGVEYFKDLYRQIKNKKAITLEKLRAIINKPLRGILPGKYYEGLASYFLPDENVFFTQRLMLNEKLQSALDKMKSISSTQLDKIHEERERIFSEKGEEFRRANEIINSELIRNFNKLKK